MIYPQTAMPLFGRSGVNEREIDTLTGLIVDEDYSAGHTFFTEGRVIDDPDVALFIVRSGRVTVTSKTGKIHTLTSGGYFGDVHLGTADGGGGECVVARTTARADEDCRVGVLSMYSIEDVLGGTSRLSEVEEGETRPSKLDETVRVEDLTKHRILGMGTFGRVWLVSRKGEDGTIEAFALKIQRKRQLLDCKQADAVIREKNIMASIDSPFIIKLVNTHQDDKCLYMLLQLVRGGELFSLLHTKRKDGVPESQSKFYAAGILEGLTYMHQRHIVYRDLKAENILIDENGYSVIVDLGFAKIVMGKTYTLCGTPLYLAPEIILSRGHDKGADYWSWGVLIYEMNAGITPFYDHRIEQLELFKRIVRGKYIFPRGIMSDECRDLVQKLLIVKPTNRLGSLAGGDRDIREHKWFCDFDSDGLMKKELKAPWVPRLKGVLDASNFENWDGTWDDLNDRPDPRKEPLTAKEQDLFKDF